MPQAVIASSTTDRSAADAERQFEPYRRELTGYCYRMLGSAFEAEDAVQETMIRAWRAFDRFEGRSSLRSWLYRIATNVCLDMLGGSAAARPPDGPRPSAAPSDSPLQRALPRSRGSARCPTRRVLSRRPRRGRRGPRVDPARVRRRAPAPAAAPAGGADPARGAALEGRGGRRAARHHRRLGEQRAAAGPGHAGAEHTTSATRRRRPTRREQALLDRYVDAFERYDIDSLAALLHEDATMSMPPYALWLQGRAEIERWLLGPGAECRGSRLVPEAANGSPAFGQYRPTAGRVVHAVGAAWCSRSTRRPDHRHQLLPRHRQRCSRCSASRRATRTRHSR